MSRMLFHFVRGPLVVCVTGKEPPTNDAWRGFISDVGAAVSEFGKARVLSRTLGGAPDVAQRRIASDVGGDRVRTALVSDSVVARSAVTAMSWLGIEIAAFSAERMNDAFDFLDVHGEDRMWATRAMYEGLAQIVPQAPR